MTNAMKRLAALTLSSTLGLLPQVASAQSCDWPAWDSYKKAMMSSDGVPREALPALSDL